MTTIRWTEQAVADLGANRDYVARDSAKNATLLVERLIASLDRVSQYPEIGRIVPEYQRAEIRAIILGSYRVVYRRHAGAAEVLTVFHGARLFPDALEASL